MYDINVIIIHNLGKNPVSGGRPAKESRRIIKVNWWVLDLFNMLEDCLVVEVEIIM